MNPEILLAQPRGFCAGVVRAIEIVEQAIAKFGAPVYVRHEIVHNAYVVNELRIKGAIFINELSEVPRDNIVIFSAHGVSKTVRAEAVVRGLKIFDSTCPLVSKVHMEVAKMRREGREIIVIGHRGHPEVEGTMGQSENGMYLVETEGDVDLLNVTNPHRMAYVSQTTLAIDDTANIISALKRKFPDIVEPKKADICFATTNRQEAVKFMALQVDIIIVIGSPNSSNSTRLREVAEKCQTTAYMVDTATQIDPAWLIGKTRVGITAGASVPEILVQMVIDRLRECGAKSVRTLDGVKERVTFPLPNGLSKNAAMGFEVQPISRLPLNTSKQSATIS